MRAIPLLPETIQTAVRNQMIEVTPIVAAAVNRNSIRSGMAVVYVAHTTAAVTINENADPDVKTDLLRKLEMMIPQNESYYRHDEGNSDSHLKASLVGQSVTVLIEHGKLQLGRWQGIYLCEFDGPRERRVLIKLVSFDQDA